MPSRRLLLRLLSVALLGTAALSLVGCSGGSASSSANLPYPTASNSGIGDPGRSTPATGNPRADADSASR